MPRARISMVATAAAAVAGVVAAHVIDYCVMFSDPAQRAALLAATGHRYWSVAVGAAAIAAAILVLCSVATGVRRASARGVRATCGIGVIPLACTQLALFGVVEVTERLAAHAAVGPFLRSRE